MAELIGIDAARDLIRSRVCQNEELRVSLTDAIGNVLAEDIVSDTDSPPYDKALMDGYAVRSDDIVGNSVSLRVLEEVTAGNLPRHQIVPGTATRIMTGAPLPDGADAVVMVEQTVSLADQSKVEICVDAIRPETAVMRQAACMRRGQAVVTRGCRLGGAEVGVLAEVGRDAVNVIRKPQVALVQTGDELVSAGQALLPGQIRNSNGPMLRALVEQAGARPDDCGIARDHKASLSAAVNQGLRSDLLILSGGVSAGVLDLVPEVLAQAGVKQVFHKVNIRPGKPIWFGVVEEADRNCLVFGLPGNPVSSLVCFSVFVAPAIAACAGHPFTDSGSKHRLAQPFELRGARPAYWPARTQPDEAVMALDWQGSADLYTITQADCLLFFPQGNRRYAADEWVEVLPLR
ncbi:MAG: molybdopterin molybdotransferase MoeA [Planctomycetaceae bacterium]|nr:molybdopterin molybdotransferase MoeA [Planctomycetaceae bacterium]